MDEMKRAAGVAAAAFVEDGWAVGLGTGSTVHHTLIELGRRVREEGLDIVGVPTSVRTERTAVEVGIPLGDLDELGRLDIAIDGADEVDPHHDLIKGLGGALLREKVVAVHSAELVVVVDESKLVERLGTRAPVPVEVLRMGHRRLGTELGSLGCRPLLRKDASTGAPFVTDNCNYIYDCAFEGGVGEPRELERRLRSMVGVVDCGLFLGLAGRVVVAGRGGVIIRARP
jgi:ribose 5-phosphate isomerase A